MKRRDENDATADTIGAGTIEIATVDVELDADEDVTRALPPARYREGRVLGRGGMGEVIAAVDTQIGREVAIKRMRGDAPTATTARFLREARIQARLDHPAIVPVYELTRDRRGNPFFVMKRLVGITLADILERIASGDRAIAARFPRQRLLRAFVDACLAIELAHTRGVVHRDLKPENIMLGDYGEVYVLDWGIARVLDGPDFALSGSIDDPEGTQEGVILGTPGYMAPEQIGGPIVDARADVFALGAILFEIATGGSALFPHGAPGLTAIFGGYDARPSSRVADPTMPLGLDAACMAATAFHPDQRTRSARHLAEQVEAVLDGDRDVDMRRRIADEASMLTVPDRIPDEVVAEVRAFEKSLTRSTVRREIAVAVLYLLFVPVFAWLGLRETWQLALVAAMATAVCTTTAYLARRSVQLQRDEFRRSRLEAWQLRRIVGVRAPSSS